MEVIMYNKRKSLLIIILALIIAILPFGTISAQSNIIYETSTVQTITSGATLENIIRFTDNGWLNINVLRIDLTNPYIKVDTLTNKNSVKKLTSTLTLARDWGAVAAINGSFFSSLGQGNGYSDGPVVQSGKIMNAWYEFNRYNDVMASFSLDKQNNVIFNYLKPEITLIAPNGKTTAVMQYNYPSRYDYTDFTILDRKWDVNSVGASQKYPDIVEMVVDNGKVVEIRQSMPPVTIPENGYVVITREKGGKFLTENFKVGDSVAMSIKTNPDWESLQMSVSGSSILVKDGKIPSKFSFDTPSISARHPRTLIGSSKDGKQLIFVTVDGRQTSSIGLTQLESAQLMLELGAYNAMNLDGGGSTTMVARTPGTNSIKTVNSPSDGSVRAVANAIGVFSIAPPSELAGLIIDTEDINVFVNTSRKLTVRGYDRYFNPISVDPEKVVWSVTGINGTFKNGTFYPTTVGEGKITAKVGNISASIDISSLSSPVKIELSKKSIKLPVGSTATFSIVGKNKNGYSAIIDPADVKWSLSGNFGKFENGVFTATSEGAGYIDALVGNAHAYCAVSVGSEKASVVDQFEKQNGSFKFYPDTVKGSYELSGEQKRSGKYSGKLTYDFRENTEVTRAAYLEFSNSGLYLPENVVKIGVWVYNSHPNSNWLRAEIRDKSGNKHTIDLIRNMDWTGWKYVEASLNGIKSPEAVTRLYTVQVNPVAEAGFMHFDDLTFITSSYPEIDASSIPKDTVPIDEANKAVEYKSASDSFRFAVLGQTRGPKNPLEKILLDRFSENVNKHTDAVAFVGQNSHEISKTIEKPFVSTNTGYKSIDIKNSRFIQLDVSKQGLRLTDKAQWHWFLNQLETFNGSNVFVFLQSTPNNFTDSLEAGLFKETLTQYRKKKFKNIWVFFSGSENASYMERGIKYISTPGLEVQGLTPDNTDIAQYILVTVKGTSVTYEFKPIV